MVQIRSCAPGWRCPLCQSVLKHTRSIQNSAVLEAWGRIAAAVATSAGHRDEQATDMNRYPGVDRNIMFIHVHSCSIMFHYTSCTILNWKIMEKLCCGIFSLLRRMIVGIGMASIPKSDRHTIQLHVLGHMFWFLAFALGSYALRGFTLGVQCKLSVDAFDPTGERQKTKRSEPFGN